MGPTSITFYDKKAEALKTEAIRILLKHPYERRPDRYSAEALSVGSNLAVADNYPFARFFMKIPAFYGFKPGWAYEAYARLSSMAYRQHQRLEHGSYQSD